jgi:hypothetical protein
MPVVLAGVNQVPVYGPKLVTTFEKGQVVAKFITNVKDGKKMSAGDVMTAGCAMNTIINQWHPSPLSSLSSVRKAQKGLARLE